MCAAAPQKPQNHGKAVLMVPGFLWRERPSKEFAGQDDGEFPREFLRPGGCHRDLWPGSALRARRPFHAKSARMPRTRIVTSATAVPGSSTNVVKANATQAKREQAAVAIDPSQVSHPDANRPANVASPAAPRYAAKASSAPARCHRRAHGGLPGARALAHGSLSAGRALGGLSALARSTVGGQTSYSVISRPCMVSAQMMTTSSTMMSMDQNGWFQPRRNAKFATALSPATSTPTDRASTEP